MRTKRLEEGDARETAFPFLKSNVFSFVAFTWMSGLISKGARRPLEADDIWQLPEKDRTENLMARFERNWEAQRARGAAQPSLVKALNQTFGKVFWLSAFPKLLNDASQFAGPIVLAELIRFANASLRGGPDAPPEYKGYLLAGIIFFSMMIGAIGENIYFFHTMRVGMHVRSVLSASIYKKALRVSGKERRNQTSGAVVNYMSADAERVSLTVSQLHLLWSHPTRILVSLVLLWQVLYAGAVIGLLTILVTVPFQAVLVTKMAKYRKLMLKDTDRRVSIVNEILNGMKVIKYYAWEYPFRNKVNAVREEELAKLKKAVVYQVTRK